MTQSMRVAAVAAGLAFAATAAEAQEYRFDIGLGGGGSWLSSALDEDRLGSDANVGFGASWLTNAQATLWFGPRLGLRANFGYADRPLEFDGTGDVFTGGPDLIDNVNLWTGTGDVMLRLAAPRETFDGAHLLPYLTAGVGARWVNPAGDALAVDADGTTGSGFTINDNDYVLRESTETLWRVGLGTDIRMSRNMSLRLEAGDMIWSAPIDAATVNGAVAINESDISQTQHEIYGTIGLSFLMGVRDVARVAVVTPPPPPPAQPMPEREPEPRPQPPAEESVTVCIAHPDVGTTGIERVSATFRPEQGDTLVDRDGTRVDIRQAYAAPSDATLQWYRTGQPLRLNAGREQIEFVTTGTPMVREDLTYLGNIEGTPVYVSQQDMQRLGDTWTQLRATDDVSAYLMGNQDRIANVRDGLTTVYTPIRPVGCEFQELRQMEPVIKRDDA